MIGAHDLNGLAPAPAHGKQTRVARSASNPESVDHLTKESTSQIVG
jgi:hypothetical protein